MKHFIADDHRLYAQSWKARLVGQVVEGFFAGSAAITAIPARASQSRPSDISPSYGIPCIAAYSTMPHFWQWLDTPDQEWGIAP